LSSPEQILHLVNSNFLLVLPFSWTFLYFSALSFALGNLIYLIFCPQIIQRFSDYSEYKSSGYYMAHLNKYTNHLFNDIDVNKREVLLCELNSLSDETNSQDIDEDKIAVIEIKESRNAYNIKKTFENNLFWLVYDSSDELKNAPLILSSVFFLIGFLLLGCIFYKNFIFVMSIM